MKGTKNPTNTLFAVLAFVIALLFLPRSCNGQNAPYKFTPKKAVFAASNFVAGAAWGVREALHADPKALERWGAKPNGFFGSNQWQRKYSADGSMKSQALGNFGRDYWHTSKYFVFGVVLTTSFCTGASKQEVKYKLLDMAVNSLSFTVGSFAAYKIAQLK